VGDGFSRDGERREGDASRFKMPSKGAAGREKAVTTPYFLIKAGGKKKGIAVVVGLAVEKSAVKRNFWKRQTKAVLASAITSGRDVVAILSPKVKTLTKKQFKKILMDAAARLEHSEP
jgi:ribonuclease P protein component